MRRVLAYRFSSLASLALAAASAIALTGCIESAMDEVGDDISCNLSVQLAQGRVMDAGRGVVYGAPLAPAPDVLARGTVEDLRFSVPTTSDTEDTLLEPSLAVQGEALAAQTQSLSCATADSAVLDGRIEARAVGTAKILVRAADGVNDAVSFEVREASALAISGPSTAEAGEELYLAADLRDAEDRPLYASSSVSWTVVEGDATLPEADADGALHGAFALIRIGAASHVVVRAEAVGFSATIELAPPPTDES